MQEIGMRAADPRRNRLQGDGRSAFALQQCAGNGNSGGSAFLRGNPSPWQRFY
jgi:hypothetical protein